jgi:hypothetical protein
MNPLMCNRLQKVQRERIRRNGININWTKLGRNLTKEVNAKGFLLK